MAFTVKQARMYADKSQNELAKALGVHVQTYRKIEEHPERATVEQAKMIAKVVGIDYDNIIFCPDSLL